MMRRVVVVKFHVVRPREAFPCPSFVCVSSLVWRVIASGQVVVELLDLNYVRLFAYRKQWNERYPI